jgi:YegS/Rv2252/BmrU family lipid kinase
LSAIRTQGTAPSATRMAGPLVIWNPTAGGGGTEDVDKRREELRALLVEHGVDAEIFASESEREGVERVDAALRDGHRTIVAAGGDGTVRAVAVRLLDRDAVLGILPMGTAMNVARSLDIPLELPQAADVLRAGSQRRIDVGQVRGETFLEVASIGASAELLAGSREAKEGRIGRAIELLRQGVRHRRTRVRLKLDGREVQGRAPAIAVANGRFTGRGLELVPQAALDDGRLDVLVFEGFGGVELLVHLARLLLGRANDRRIRRYRAATVEVRTHRPLPIRIDSGVVGTTPAVFSTRLRALRVIAPARLPAPTADTLSAG